MVNDCKLSLAEWSGRGDDSGLRRVVSWLSPQPPAEDLPAAGMASCWPHDGAGDRLRETIIAGFHLTLLRGCPRDDCRHYPVRRSANGSSGAQEALLRTR